MHERDCLQSDLLTIFLILSTTYFHRVKRFLRNERDIRITVRGISDSGWFLDRDPYIPTAIAAADVVQLGYKLWGGDLPEACTAKHTKEPWRCYFGHRLYPTLRCK